MKAVVGVIPGSGRLNGVKSVHWDESSNSFLFVCVYVFVCVRGVGGMGGEKVGILYRYKI